MYKKHVIILTAFAIVLVSCGTEKVKETEVVKEEKTLEIINSGQEEIIQLLDNLSTGKIQVNTTTKSDLASIYGIEENDYYMNKKIELEDHVMYINFTISKDVLTKISYATLSNSPKDFSYITNLITDQFGEDYDQTFITPDSLNNNASKIWNMDTVIIQYDTFSDLNSGYEIIIK